MYTIICNLYKRYKWVVLLCDHTSHLHDPPPTEVLPCSLLLLLKCSQICSQVIPLDLQSSLVVGETIHLSS